MASSKCVYLHIRLKPKQLRRWQAAARRADETLSEFVRTRMDLHSGIGPAPVPPVVSGPQLRLPKVDK